MKLHPTYSLGKRTLITTCALRSVRSRLEMQECRLTTAQSMVTSPFSFIYIILMQLLTDNLLPRFGPLIFRHWNKHFILAHLTTGNWFSGSWVSIYRRRFWSFCTRRVPCNHRTIGFRRGYFYCCYILLYMVSLNSMPPPPHLVLLLFL